MEEAGWWLSLCLLGILAAPSGADRPCMHGFTINVILLDDDDSFWSLKYVKGEILKAIETDKALNPEGKTQERCSHRPAASRFPARARRRSAELNRQVCCSAGEVIKVP